MCSTGQLRGSVVQGSGGSAGAIGVDLALTNTGSGTCTLQGWSGVSLVGDSNGTQLGAAARQDRATYPHATVALRSGGTAYVPVEITQAQNYSASTCKPQQAQGFRVYPPGQTASLYIPYSVTACTTGVDLLTVSAIQTSAK